MEHIILNWLPPASVQIPSPAHSVIKDYLGQNGIVANILYWNIKMYDYIHNFFNLGKDVDGSDLKQLLPFFMYLAIECNDYSVIEGITSYILTEKPQYHIKGREYIIKRMHKEYISLDKLIDQILLSINITDIKLVGFSSQFYQWIPALIIAKKLKKRFPEVILFVGGFGTSEEARLFLKNFTSFDFASWGEGEFSDYMLINYLKNETKHNVDNIPHLAYRNNQNIVCTKNGMSYSSLDKVEFNIDDYIHQSTGIISKEEMILPIETGRGCHWNKCHFCYLNIGYKFRRKSNQAVINEIRNKIEKYAVYNFEFLDNDLIGGDFCKFEDLLNQIMGIKASYEKFSIKMAEIITKGLSSSLVKKMKMAGFENVQIGYESPSDILLKKISKKNSFASNLLFIKWAIEYGIKVSGANVIRNLLEETKDDIIESIDNLKYLRFYISTGGFSHNYSNLAVSASSRYLIGQNYHINERKWFSTTYSYFPHNLINDEDKMSLFYDFVEKTHNPLWNTFAKIENFYINNKLKYRIIKDESGLIVYEERLNEAIISKLEFEKTSMYWEVLIKCNSCIMSIDALLEQMNQSINLNSLKEIIVDLSHEGLLYHSQHFDEIVTVINTNKIL